MRLIRLSYSENAYGNTTSLYYTSYNKDRVYVRNYFFSDLNMNSSKVATLLTNWMIEL